MAEVLGSLSKTLLWTVLEKLSVTSDPLFSFQVGTAGVRLVYGTTGDSAPLVFSADVNIPRANWTHITLQVHNVAANIYINGPGEDLTPTVSSTLLRPVADGTGSYRVGQSGDGSNQFIGRVQDLNFYSLALSNREIVQIYSGEFPGVRIQSACRCQSIYPRIKPGDTTVCIKNGGVATTTDTAPRLSRNAHPLEYLNDGNSNSMWISSYLNEVEIEVDLGDEFQVTIKYLFVSESTRGQVDAEVVSCRNPRIVRESTAMAIVQWTLVVKYYGSLLDP
ncbi:usherin [Elysia marginata]|uniref:Usherin n=1 Tax=Elysia marginata TaxID=1093978 RepID=A0AAV4G9T3_9GAST|nr:usherin [Elysia marginata]